MKKKNTQKKKQPTHPHLCIKSDFKEIILKLATYGQREKAILLSAPAWGYIHVKKKHIKKR